MYIRKVEKKNKGLEKTYTYYRLIYGYKIGNKVRQQTLLNLGKLEGFPKEKHKALADKIEILLTGTTPLFDNQDIEIDKLAHKYVAEIQAKGLFPGKKRKASIGTGPKEDFHEININTIEEEESREIGGEWLCKQAFNKLGISPILSQLGMTEDQIDIALMLLTAKMIHPSSENEIERWLKENSGAMELYGQENFSITRYRLYQAATELYDNKKLIEKGLYTKCSNLFSQRNKVVIYDLTNMYFEGQMKGSDKAHFGRSKEKRSDCRLISLAMTIDSQGFVRNSQFYPGNVSEPETLTNMLEGVKQTIDFNNEKPLIVIDAGIATEDNLALIKEKGYDYICVSRTHPKEFSQLADNAEHLKDNRGNQIEVRKIAVEGTLDCFLQIRSDQKAKKEESMDKKLTDRFEERLKYIQEGLSLPRRLKKTVKVHEAIGRIKNQFSKVAKLYEITYQENIEKGTVKQISWERIKTKEKPMGEYFLRYSKEQLTEKEIWDGYNLTREIEADFRCLKTDLNIRPIFHQKDQHIESHVWLGILAFQIVNYIRQNLKLSNINYSWKTIVEKMKSQKTSLISMNAKKDKRLFVKLCTKPNNEVNKIYDALGYKNRPYARKTKVVTQK